MHKRIAVSLGILVILLVGVAPVLAVSDKAAAQAAVNTRLTDAKLKACQSQEAAIQKRSKQLIKTTENMETTFARIAQHVEDYYTTTVIPSGKTVANYDALTSAIATKKAAVDAALAAAKADAAAFTCAGLGPKEQLTKFRTDMQAVKKALQEYRTSIKDLIVAVRSLTGTTNKTDNSGATD